MGTALFVQVSPEQVPEVPEGGGLPEDLRAIVAKNINAAADLERADVAKLNAGLREDLVKNGMTVNETDAAPFREALRKAGFYADWKKRYGDEAWAILEKAVGSQLS